MEPPQEHDERLTRALATLSLSAITNDASPEWAAQVSEACSVLAAYDWNEGKAMRIECPGQVLDHYGIDPSTLSQEDVMLLVLVLAVEGVVSSSKPEAHVLDKILGLVSPLLHREPNSVLSLCTGLVLRMVRLCLPFCSAQMGECGLLLYRSANGWLEALTTGSNPDDMRPPLLWMMESFGVCTAQHLTFLAEEAASFVLVVPAFLEESAEGGSGTEGEPGSDSEPSLRPLQDSFLYVINWLLTGMCRGNPSISYYTGKRNDRRFYRIMEERLFKSPPAQLGPDSASCFPLDPIRLIQTFLAVESKHEVDELRTSSFALFFSNLLDLIYEERDLISPLLDQRRVAELVGLAGHLIEKSSRVLRDSSTILSPDGVPHFYSLVESCSRLICFAIGTGRMSPVDFSKSCGDAMSDLIDLSITLPRITPQQCRDVKLDFFVDEINQLFLLVSRKPVSRAELMRATMRSGALDRVRAALRFITTQASRRTSDFAAPASLLLPVNEPTKKSFDSFFFMVLNSLGRNSDRAPGGLACFSPDPACLRSYGAVSGGLSLNGADALMIRIHIRTILLLQQRPTGAQLLADQALNLGPLIDDLERDTAAIIEVTGGSWAVHGLAEYVHTLHDIVAAGLEEAAALRRAEGRGPPGEPGGSGQRGPRPGRGRNKAARLRALESRFSGWQKRLRGLGKRLLLEYFPRAEARSQAAWVLGSEEVVALVRGAGEGLPAAEAWVLG